MSNVSEHFLKSLEDAAKEAGRKAWCVGGMESGRVAVDDIDGNEITGWIDEEHAFFMTLCSPANILVLVAHIRELKGETPCQA